MKDTLLQQSILFRPQHRKDLLRYKTAKRTLDALLDYVDSYGETFVGIKTLANRLIVSNQTIINHFEILQELGVLEIEKIGNKSYKKIQFDGSRDGSKDGSSEGSKDGSKDSSSEGSSEGSSGLEAKEVTERKEHKEHVANAPDIESEFEDMWRQYREVVSTSRKNTDKKHVCLKKYTECFVGIKKKYKDVDNESIFDFIFDYLSKDWLPNAKGELYITKLQTRLDLKEMVIAIKEEIVNG